MKKRITLHGIAGKLLVVLYSIFLLMPIYFVISTSLKEGWEVSLNPLGLPSAPQFRNFYDAIVQGSLVSAFSNSVLVTSCTIAVSLVLTLLLSYGLYKLFNTRAGFVFYTIIMLGLVIAPVGYINLILHYKSLHLYNTLLGVILCVASNSIPFSTFLMVGHFRSLPSDLTDAAIIDGCTDLKALVYIFVPLSKPIITTIVILNLVTSWNNFLLPLLLLTDQKLNTIPLSLMAFKGIFSVQYNLLFAALIITAVPMLVLYLLFQKNFVEGLAGAVKG